MGQYFSLDKLSAEMQDGLKSQALDFGSTMLKGEASNIFCRAVEGDSLSEIGGDMYNEYTNMAATAAGNVVSNVTGSAENLVGTASTALLNAPDFAMQLASDIFDDMSNQLSTYLANAVEDMLKLPTISDVMSLASKRLSYHLVSTGDIMKELKSSKEELMEVVRETAKTDKLNKTISDVQEKVGKAKKVVGDTLKTFNSYLDTVTAYIQQGPDWVVEQVDIYKGWAIEQVEKQVGKVTKEVNKNKKIAIEFLADKAAAGLAVPINAAKKKALKLANDKIQVQKEKAMIKAKAAIGSAILKIMALVGG